MRRSITSPDPARPQAAAAQPLLGELRELINAARQHIAQTANASLTLPTTALHRHMGRRAAQNAWPGIRPPGAGA